MASRLGRSTGGRTALVWFGLLGWAAACSSGASAPIERAPDPKPEETGRDMGELCDMATACRSDLSCITLQGVKLALHLCSKSCASDRDCRNGTVCGVGDDGSATCLPRCQATNFWNYVCIDDTPTACAATDGKQCESCGCAENDYCHPSKGCLPLGDVGDPCDLDAGCKTSNCDPYARVCRVQVGSACTADNCERCMSAGGFSYCSRECSDEAQCNGGPCLGEAGQNLFTCYQLCPRYERGSCPDVCSPFGDAKQTDYYCDCPSCSIGIAPRPLGARCRAHAECDSGECYGFIRDLAGYGSTSFCSRSCESSADCGGDLVCADAPCADGETESCGKHCTSLCEADTQCENRAFCRELPTTEGELVNVCDIKLPAGETCGSAKECRSGVCADHECQPGGGAGVGSACQAAVDCQSQNCLQGVCHGLEPDGTACTDGLRCKSGLCCPWRDSNLKYCRVDSCI